MLVNLAWLQNYAWERWLVWRIGITLGLECKRTTIEDWLVVLVVVLTVEEVTAVELQCNLIAPNLHTATALWRIDVGNLDYLAVILAVDDEVVVVTCTCCELLVVVVYSLADSVRLAEIERGALNRHNLTCRDKQVVHRGYRFAVDSQDVVKNRAFAITLEVEE